MHLVYSVREPLGNELRYSLRSVAANLPVERITFIGDKPDWVKGVEHIEGNRIGEPYCNSYDNALIAAKNFPGTWYSMNDDFFVLKPMTEIPHWWERSMVQQAARSPDPRSLRHRQLMLDTNMYLSTQRGVVIPKSYELHIPMRIVGEELIRVARSSAKVFTPKRPPRWRSLYGNLSKLVYPEATQREDVKFHILKHLPEDSDFLSTDERTFKNFLPMLAKKFPKKSPWEK